MSNDTLPPHVLQNIFQHLTIPELGVMASVSKEFQAQVYQDVLWRDKLRTMLSNDHGLLAKILDESNVNRSVIALENVFSSDKTPASNNPYRSLIEQQKMKGFAREQFKQLYLQLFPYYSDLRDNTKESTKILCEFKEKPEKCGQVINLLTGLGQCQVVDDWREINEDLDALSHYFESVSLHQFQVAYDDHNIPDMKSYASALIALNGGSLCIQSYIEKHSLFDTHTPFKPQDNFIISHDDLTPFKKLTSLVTDDLEQQSLIALEVFPENMDAFYLFVDRVFDDVMAEYIGQLLARAMSFGSHTYLRTMSVVLSKVKKLVDRLSSDDLPKKIEPERGINLMFKLFLPFLDDYLEEESNYAETITKRYIDDWTTRSAMKNIDNTARVTNQTRETFKRNYLTAFKKVLTLPVDLVSTAATTIASPFQRASLLPPKRAATLTIEIPTTTPQSTPPSTPTSTSMNRSSSTSTLQSETTKSYGKEVTGQLEFARQELDMLQNYLSLETSLQLIHINKESERRIQQFIDIGFPGRMKTDIQKTYEQIFVHFLRRLGTTHIQPGFESATARLASYKPSNDGSNEDVPPLTEFFELVHVADVIQQMMQLYYDEEITKNVDKHDFMNDVNKEKKQFERLLDDSVAQGMDRGIQVLLNQVEFILANEQTKEDYNPTDDLTDMKPTKACQDTIQCLKTNTSMLVGAAEKGTMDLFFSEIGRRFFEILCKHLKTQTVNEIGGFRYICDMNAYYDFIITLRQKTITPYFLALKNLANLYIIDSAADIKSLIHDLERYHGLFRIEDLFEFAACRSDWPTIRRAVQKDMTDCCIM